MGDEQAIDRSPAGVKRIVVSGTGSYHVEGGIPLRVQKIVRDEKGQPVGWEAGESYPTRDNYKLCRCGESAHKPYCDHTHRHIVWDPAETASREPFQSQSEPELVGPTLRLTDVRALCASAGFCHRLGGVWRLTRQSGDPERREVALQEAQNCPAGRLVMADQNGQVLEPELEPAIGLVEDESGRRGPLWVQGGIPIVAADGETYEVRNRVTLCRCGLSANKPFCDGSHRLDGEPE